MVRHRSLPFVLLVALCSALATAQGPKGIAYVEAPERAAGVCVAGSPDKGFACARERCAESGIPGNECLRRACRALHRVHTRTLFRSGRARNRPVSGWAAPDQMGSAKRR